MELNIDKSQWVKVQFGDVVQKVSNKIDPETYPSEIVIQGGHINKRDFHIREYENKNELGYLGPAFHMGFKKHQILYVSRNPHLMKVGYPHFDGICANTTFIMETKDEGVLRNDLIPFIMHSDTFIEQSVANVRGGVNPYVNWSDLACIEFLLPPKDQQAQLAKLLWAMDEVIESDMNLLLKSSNFFNASRNSIFSNSDLEHKLNFQKSSDCVNERFDKVYKTKSVNGIYKSKEFHGRGTRMINMGELFGLPIIRNEEMDLVELTAKESKQYLVEEGDLIFARRSLVVEGAGRCSIIGKHESPMTFESSMIRLRLDRNKVNPKFIYHFLKSIQGRKQIRRIIGFTTVAGITSSDLAVIQVPVPNLEDQNEIVNYLDQFDSVFEIEKLKITTSKSLQKSLINQVF